MRILFIILLLTGCATKEKSPKNIFFYELPDTGSMEPALSGGDIIYLDRSFEYEDLKVGDVVAYYEPKYGIINGILHRIVRSSSPKEWVVKGDNNKNIDRYNLNEESYYGKLIRVDFK